jgi:hypothetical protein
VGSNDDGSHFEEGAAWGEYSSNAEVPVREQISTSSLPHDGVLTDICDYGTSYLLIDTGGQDKNMQLNITLNSSSDTLLGAVGSRITTTAPSEDLILIQKPRAGSATGSIELGSSTQIMLGITNMARPDYDPDPEWLNPTECTTIEYSIELAKAGGGCSCNTLSSTTVSPWLWIVGTGCYLLLQSRKQRYALDKTNEENS